MNAAGTLRHGKAHRKQGRHLRVALAKSEIWRIRISERVTVLRLSTGFKIPQGAHVAQFMDFSAGGVILLVQTQPGTLMQFEHPLPRGVTAERIE